MIKRVTLFALLLVGLLGVFQLSPVLAQVPAGDPLGVNFGEETGLSDQDVRISIAHTIKFILSFLGLIFLILVLYAGSLWMTSAGNEDKVDKAKKILAGAVIGVAIILASYAITDFVVTNLYETTR